MKRIITAALAAIVACIVVPAALATGSPPNPECPAGYTKAGTTNNGRVLLCTKETIKEVEKIVYVDRPVEVIVYRWGNPTCPEGTTPEGEAKDGAIVCIKTTVVERIVDREVIRTVEKIVYVDRPVTVEKIVEKIVEVPVEKIVVVTKTKTKTVYRILYKVKVKNKVVTKVKIVTVYKAKAPHTS